MKRSLNRPITISQVAVEAGVSSQTVSRVVNNRGEISPETRQRVKEVIQRMGYHPNVIARSLSQQRSHTLGVVASGIEFYGPSRSLLGIEQAANNLGYSILLSLVHQPKDGSFEKVYHNLISRQVEGIIWQVPEIGDNRAWLRQEAQQPTTPVIFMDMQPDMKLNTVSVDNFTGGLLATQHLVSQGYQKIGLITGPLNWRSALERMRGWQEALLRAGFPNDDRWMVEGDWSARSGEQGCIKLFESFPEMEAVFVSNDQMAFGVYQAACRLGKRIPEDLAIVGFDDIPESAYFCPPLTTVAQDLFELGKLAVQAFINIYETAQTGVLNPQPQTFVVQPNLVVRASSMSAVQRRRVNPIN
jgi:LacI family transcriptional regulator